MYYPPPQPTWCGCLYAQDQNHACTQLCGCTGACQYPHMYAHMPPPPHPHPTAPPMEYYGQPQYGYGYPPVPQVIPQYPLPQVQPVKIVQEESEKMSSEEASSQCSNEGQHQYKSKNVKAQLLGILNRFTEVKYAENFNAVKKILEDGSLEVSELVDIVHDQAVIMPSFAQLYARLCNDLCERLALPNTVSKKELMVTSPFRRTLLQKCQNRFREVIESCEQSSHLDKQKEKEILSFICALHTKGVVGTQTILACVDSLIKAACTSLSYEGDALANDCVYVDLLLTVIPLVSASISSKPVHRSRVESIYCKLSELVEKVCTRQKFLLQNLVEKRVK
eukprot:TRINITY_DN12140_c1_g1_i1.p1 TRINITY_DN12140_c1_g1~~TRINITY_DN12140_c1_g1_i1.p1  ORF type:complete len:352 (+),score=50.51 TRINITY_DN12140_c1_g1_i1:49-1056(+)